MGRTFSQNEDSLRRDQHDRLAHTCDYHKAKVSHTPGKVRETKWMQRNRTTYQDRATPGGNHGRKTSAWNLKKIKYSPRSPNKTPDPCSEILTRRTGEAGDSSRLVPAIMPPACPRLYLKAQQEALLQTSFLPDSRNDEQSCFLARKSYNSLADQSGVTLPTDRVCAACCMWIRGPFSTAQLRALSI